MKWSHHKVGSRRFAYQLAFFMPGRRPCSASCLNMILEILYLRYTPFERPVMMQRLETRDAELFRGRAFNACWAVKRS